MEALVTFNSSTFSVATRDGSEQNFIMFNNIYFQQKVKKYDFKPIKAGVTFYRKSVVFTEVTTVLATL